MNQLRHVAQHKQIAAIQIMDVIVHQIVPVIVPATAISQHLKMAAADAN